MITRKKIVRRTLFNSLIDPDIVLDEKYANRLLDEFLKDKDSMIINRLRNNAKEIKSEGFTEDEISEKMNLIYCLEVVANYLEDNK